MAQSKYWCFTLNNPTDDELAAIRNYENTPDVYGGRRLSYLVGGFEVGANGTPHIQGYLELSKRCQLSVVRRIGGLGRAHFERRRGTAEQARTYCLKESNQEGRRQPIEFGEISAPASGARTDLDRIAEGIRDGSYTTLGQIWRDWPSQMVRYHVGIGKMFDQLRPDPEPRSVFPLDSEFFQNNGLSNLRDDLARGGTHVIQGPSGCGKTSFALAVMPKALVVSHMDQLRGFDPEKHDGIIFDDMSFKHIPREAQIHLVDQDLERALHIRYGVGLIPANTRKVFTTNADEIFDMSDPAIARRVTVHRVGSGFRL